MGRKEKNDKRRKAAGAAAQECVRVLKQQFGVREAYIFGSLRGDSPWHEWSDVDIAVEGLAPERYFKALTALYQRLPPGLELDLVSLEGAVPELVALAKGEVKMPEGLIEAMKMEVENELKNLERVVERASVLLAKISETPSEEEIISSGKRVHDFYNGVEQTFERIEKRVEVPLPAGENWHTLLLEQAERDVPNRRPAVIDHALAVRLQEYLRFRHLFRHTYGDDLAWARLCPLVEMLPQLFTEFKTRIERFLSEVHEEMRE